MKKLLTGDEAIARGLYEAGVSFASAYPGTPSTEILENVAKYDDMYAEWAPNEKVAMEAAIGASMSGVRSFAAMKMVGVNVAADPLFTFTYLAINGGFAFVSADDPGMHSSQNEQDNRNYAKFAKIAMFEPSDSQECIDMTKEAYKVSETYGVPRLPFQESRRRTGPPGSAARPLSETAGKNGCRTGHFQETPLCRRRTGRKIEGLFRNLSLQRSRDA